MNRNEMYHILTENGLKVRRRYNHNTNGYHFRMHFDDDITGIIELGNGLYVRGFSEVALCMNEIVIISKFDDMKVNVKYDNITKVDVYKEYDEDGERVKLFPHYEKT